MHNVFGLVMLIATAALLVWSSIRAWRATNKLFKWGGVGIAALLATAVSLTSVLTIAGLFKMHTRSAPVPDLKVAGTPEQIQRGQAIADSFCGACHSQSGPLTGGADIGEHFPIPVGSFVASNLTPAGQLNHWSDGEIFRAVRNAIDADGHWLTIMSYTNSSRLSDADITAPPKAPTVQYGEYILSYQDCRECHGANLTGGVEGQLGPLGPDLNLVKEWKLEEFVATMRTGTDPSGHELSEQMPWRPIGKMDDEELGAVYEYLTHLPGSQNTAVN
jgi:mono/diheme cytochrome c family protein